MSLPSSNRRTGVPLLEVGLAVCALIGVVIFIGWGLLKSRETARRGVARTELAALGFSITEKNGQNHISAADVEVDEAVLNLICVFQYASSLRLQNSWITGAGLQQIAVEMPALQTLELPGSRLRDEDLNLLTAFPELKLVSLRRSLIRGDGLKVLPHLSRLKSIDLSDNELTDDCRHHLAAADAGTQLLLANTWLSETALIDLKRTGCQIADRPSGRQSYEQGSGTAQTVSGGELPSEYHLLSVAHSTAGQDRQAVRYVDHPYRNSHFRWLRVSGIRLLTSELELIAPWSKLEFLDLTSLHVAGVTFYRNRRDYRLPLGHLRDLKTLSLAGTGVGDHAISPLAQCRSLRYLDLRMTDLNGDGLVAIAKLPRIEVLRLSHNLIEDDDLVHLAGLKSLKQLELDSTDITGTGLRHLDKLTNLKQLSISRTGVTEKMARATGKKMGVRVVTDRPYDAAPRFHSGPALRRLLGIADGTATRSINLRREAPFTEELIRQGFHFSFREDGRAGTAVSKAPKVTIDQLRYASRLYGLKSLAIPANGLTTVGVTYLSRLPELATLTLSGAGISSSQVRTLRQLKALRSVRLEPGTDTPLTDAEIADLRRTGLRIEVVSGQTAAQ